MQSTVLGFLKIQINNRTCAMSNTIATSYMWLLTVFVIHNSAARAPFRMLRGRPHAPDGTIMYISLYKAQHCHIESCPQPPVGQTGEAQGPGK